MGLLPSSTLIHGIQQFLTTVLEEKTVARRRTHVIRSLYLAENMQVYLYMYHEHHIFDASSLSLLRFQEFEYVSSLLILLSKKRHSVLFVRRRWE